nr:DDB1- and CUL4-associated factor 4-like protein 1 isoform X2 [Erigeron canadensis]
MLHVRELCGNSISSNKKKVNFENQYQKIRASKPIVWKYQETERDSDAALEHVYVNVQTRDGLTESEVLLTGGLNNMFRCYEVGSVMERDGIIGWEIVPDLLQPTNIEKQTASLKSPGPVYSPHLFQMGSNISCIKIPRNYDPQATDVDSSVSHALMTTLGSETSGGSVCLMNLSEPLDLGRRIDEISVFKSTIWTADSYSDGSRAVVGTNIGAALVNIETGRKSWICRSKSDVLSLQLDYSGKLVLCGLRNGAIVTVDTRQKPQDLHAGCPKHEISFPSIKTGKSNSARGQKRDKQWFEVRGNVDHSRMIFMPSSISCLVALKLYDQYFLASSMDGTMRLYDHRLTQRGAVQLYEGNVNSHTRIQMGVDPSERFLMSGGEDFYMRMWSIKSGEMLYEDKFMNSVPSVLCWARGGPDCNRGPKNHLPGAWLGSQEGLFYVNTS